MKPRCIMSTLCPEPRPTFHPSDKKNNFNTPGDSELCDTSLPLDGVGVTHLIDRGSLLNLTLSLKRLR